MHTQKAIHRIILLVINVLVCFLPHLHGQGNADCNLVTCGDQTIFQGQSVQLSVSGATNYLWTPSTGLSDPTSATPIASPTTTTTYSVTGTYYSENNLVVNGDFSQGNMGFTSQYSYNSNIFGEGTYYVDSDPSIHHPQFVGHGHTTGSDKFMMVNGATIANKVVWQQTITVVPNTQYCFSTWVCSLSSADFAPTCLPKLQFAINGVQIGSEFQSPSSLNTWDNFYVLWDSGNATQATITIKNTNQLALSGNDFGLDDISFFGYVECPNSQQVTVNVENRSGMVNVTANPSTICVGESAQLHAEATTDLIIDFEPGDFSQFNFQNNGTYPWVVVSAETMDGSVYCMRSGNQGIANTTSTITATYNFPNSGSIRFDARCMGEGYYTYWDECTFKIDGVTQFSYGAQDIDWNYYGYNVSAGSHTFTWSYSKDGTVNPTGDAFFVDNIVFSNHPVEGGTTLGNTYDFENGNFQGWRKIDADGDGNNWKIGSPSNSSYDYYSLSIPGRNNSSHCVYSESFVCSSITYDYYEYVYTFNGEAVTPNNYLVSPSKITVHDGAFISFWACGVTITDHTEEHFGVAISTKNYPTSGSDFTTIQEWTMSYSSGSYQGWPYQTAWRRYTVDLSAYAGQSIWVAIRHFDCNYKFYLGVDDISIYEGSDNPGGDEDIEYVWDNGMTGPNITVWPTETTTYTVTAYQNNNVIGTGSKTVVVYTDLNLSITTNVEDNSICEGDTITLYVSVDPPLGVRVGDILCTDDTFVKPYDWPVSGKTAKAVVFYVDGTGMHGWAVGLQDMYKTWGPLNETVSGLHPYSHWLDALNDMNGLSNTQQIRNKSNASQYPAASSVDFNNGWYLPSIGQLNTLFGSIFEVNTSLNAIGGTNIKYAEYWSSTTSTANNYSWMFNMKNGGVLFDQKSKSKNVRSVINF